MARLEPMLFELERQKQPVLVVSHLSVLQCLYAYFLDIDVEEVVSTSHSRKTYLNSRSSMLNHTVSINLQGINREYF